MRFFNRRSDKPAHANLDQQLVFHLSKSRIPSPKQLKYAPRFLSRTERIVLSVSAALMIAGLAYVGTILYRNHIELVPKAGGTYTEGLVGNPQYINPLYASLNGADADLERLLFSRLFTTDALGAAVPDLADSVIISDGEKTYTIKLKTAVWTTGEPVTADDVVFTFGLIQNPDFKSPLRTQFAGVTAKKIDDTTVAFMLREPYGRFPSLLTFGIMPASLWEAVSDETMPLAEFNIKPIGSGPYQFKTLVKNRAGTIRSYTLERNPAYYGTAPYLDEITFKFFPSGQEMIAALNNGQINGLRSLPADIEDTIVAKNALAYKELEQPGLTAAFFNLKAGLLADVSVRRALRAAVNQTEIVTATVGRNGHPAYSPLPSFLPGATTEPSFDLNLAATLLDTAGWTNRSVTAEDVAKGGDFARLGQGSWRMKNDKGIILKISASEAMRPVAEALAAAWKQIGIKADPAIAASDEALGQMLANRQFEVVVYSENLPEGEPFPFWHSTGAGNISGYARNDVDSWLEQARLTADRAAAADRYAKFQQAIASDAPVIPLYWNTYIYPQSKKLKGMPTTAIVDPADRLNQIGGWYVKTKRKLK